MSVPCKADFMAAMSEVEAVLPAVVAPAEEFPAPVEMIDTNEPLNVQEAMYLVFFDFDSDDVNADGESVLDAVANEVNSRNINTINVVGHTDTSGSTAYNARLANRRGNDVKSALIARGVPAGKIMIEGRGENELLVQTQNDIREPANRRAVITFE
jgi:OOP family OmpA-OmpF porin